MKGLVGKKKFAQNAQTFCFFFGLEKPDTEMEKARARPHILLNTFRRNSLLISDLLFLFSGEKLEYQAW